MKKLNKKSRISLLLIIFIVSLISGICYYIHSGSYAYTDDAYISGHSSYISPHIAGYVNEICVKDNQIIKKGQILLTIDPTPFIAKVAEYNAALKVQKTQLESDMHLEAVSRAKLKFALFQYKRYKLLSEEHAQSLEKFQSFTSELNQEKSNLESKLVQIQKDKALIKQAEADLLIAQINVSYTKIYAPFDGWVTKKTTALGNYVNEGEDLMAIVPTNLYIDHRSSRFLTAPKFL